MGGANPRAVFHALAEHRIPALVTAGTFCRTAVQPAPGVGDVAVFSSRAGLQTAETASGRPGQIVIYGSRIPRGVELSIGYRQDPQGQEISFTLIQAGAPRICTRIPDSGPYGND